MNIDTPEVLDLLCDAKVGTQAAAKCLRKSSATIRRYAKTKKLRNVGSDASFRFRVYDILKFHENTNQHM